MKSIYSKKERKKNKQNIYIRLINQSNIREGIYVHIDIFLINRVDFHQININTIIIRLFIENVSKKKHST
jgi:hypothetical protein